MKVSLAEYSAMSAADRQLVTEIDLTLDKLEERGYVSLREVSMCEQTSDQYVEAAERQLTFEGFNKP
ncbi:MAG: hypothetical protein E6Q97_34830 [Desulfurellales bacterium]|nr:MAG: hypothetical protein E6Q97_34830 [Desulfurellales bacterium]